MSERENLIPDFDFEVDSPVLENTQEEETVEEQTVEQEQEENPTVATDFNPEPIEEQEQEQETETSTPEYGEGADPNIVAAYNFYKDRGIIKGDYEDEFDGSPEKFEEIMLKEDERKYGEVYDYIVGNSPDFAKSLVELVLNKGANTTPEEVQELFEITKPSEIKAEDLSEEDGAAEYLKSYYMQKHGDTEDEALERIDLLRDRNKLTKEAETIFKNEEQIKQQLAQSKVDQAKQETQQQKAREEAFNQSFIGSIKETPWRDDLKEKVAQEFYSGAFKQRMDHIFQNPTALSQLVNFMRYYDGKTFNLSEFEKSIASGTNEKRKSNIQSYWSNNVTSGGVHKNSEQSDGIDLTKYEIEI